MKHLTKEQRYTICVMKKQGYKQNEIAKAIGKNKSVVCRELKRNCDKRSGEYKSELAQRKHDQRQKGKPKKTRLTQAVKEHVGKFLEQDYSPEQIVGRAKHEKKDCVSHERIYQYIWEDKKRGGVLHLHLRRKGRKYRKRGYGTHAAGATLSTRPWREKFYGPRVITPGGPANITPVLILMNAASIIFPDF